MYDDRKRILSPFTGCKKRKAWNKTREKYMTVKRRQKIQLKQTGSYYKEERLEEFLDSKGAFYNVNESDNDDESYNRNNGQQQLAVTGGFCQQLLQNSYTNSSTKTN